MVRSTLQKRIASALLLTTIAVQLHVSGALSLLQNTPVFAPLIGVSTVAAQTATFSFNSRADIRSFVNSLGTSVTPAPIPPEFENQGALEYDTATAQKICEYKGYSAVVSSVSDHWSSCYNNHLAYWNGSQFVWEYRNACARGNDILERLTCGQPIAAIACQDGIDNDGDGAMDYPADFSCTSPTDSDETNPKAACQDGIDNDGDGRIDFPSDPGCVNAQDNDEFSQPPSECSDGIDNDNDGATDLADFSCGNNPNDNDETNPKAACQDGQDNDGDGLRDFPNDPGCQNRQDNDESNPALPQCSDRIDNDGDGKIDAGNCPINCRTFTWTSSQSFDQSSALACDGTVTLDFGNDNVALTVRRNGGTTEHVLGVCDDDYAHAFPNRCATPDDNGAVLCDRNGGLIANLPKQANRGAICPVTSGYAINVLAGDILRLRISPEFPYENPPSTVTFTPDPRYTGCGVTPDPECRDGNDNSEAPVCGDGAREGGETCDDGAQNGQPGRCNATCSGTVPLFQCSDGQDNDGDGLRDFPQDPGCVNAQDNDEFNAAACVAHPWADRVVSYRNGTSDISGSPNFALGAPQYTRDVNFYSMGKGGEIVLQFDELITNGPGNDLRIYEATHNPNTHPLEFAQISVSSDGVTWFNIGTASNAQRCDCNTNTTDLDLGTVQSARYVRVRDTSTAAGADFDLNAVEALNCSNATQCQDGIDNDGDGAMDYPGDFSCSSPTDNDETNPKAACQDGIDNDGDGLRDFPQDPGCVNAQDNDEFNQPQCSDGIDNDGDGATDYPADPGCISTTDNDESNTPPTLVVTKSTSASQVQAGNSVTYTIRIRNNGGVIARNVRFFDYYGIDYGPQVSTLPFTLTSASGATCTPGHNPTGGAHLECLLPVGQRDIAPGGEKTITLTFTTPTGQFCNQRVHEFVAALTDGTSQLFIASVDTDIVCPAAQCQDGIDNDNDGATDLTDFSCGNNPNDNDETNPKAACQDGQDNDGDGLRDFPQDPGCINNQDNDEFNAPDITLTSVTGNGCNVTVSYSKNFDTCAHLLVSTNNEITHMQNVFCGRNGPVTVPTSTFNSFFQVGTRVKLCHGNNYNNCSSPVTISGTTQCLAQCQDGIDNDNDGATDLNDFSCGNNPNDNDETNPKAACQDGQDNDGDGLRDFPQDPGCVSNQDNDEFNAPQTVDLVIQKSGPPSVVRGQTIHYTINVANQGQANATNLVVTDQIPAGLVYNDAQSFSTCTQVGNTVQCTRASLNAGQAGTFTIAFDTPAIQNCTQPVNVVNSISVTATQQDSNQANNSTSTINNPTRVDCPQVPQCSDGIDNDNDGATDLADFSCSNNPNDNDETNPKAACQDGFDNDFDGRVDFPQDPGCVSNQDNDEFNAPLPACRDGIDNDNDGRTDSLDPGCSNPDDTNEGDEAACQDLRDNDQDGLIDFPFDPGCVSPTDTDEFNAPQTVDVSVIKTGPQSVTRGQPIFYSIQVGNGGQITATNVVVTDQVPAGLVYNDVLSYGPCELTNNTVSCALGSLAPSQFGAFTIAFDTPPVQNCTVTNVVNTATISTTQLDSNQGNNSSSTVNSPTRVDCPPVTQCSDGIDNDGDGRTDGLDAGCQNPTDNNEGDGPADLAVSLTGPQTVQGGSNATYIAVISNNGPDAVTTPFSIRANVPAGTTFNAASSSQGCTQNGAVVTCSGITLGAGQQTTRSIVFTIPGQITSATNLLDQVLGVETAYAQFGGICNTTITVTVTIVNAANPDPNQANNSSTVSTFISCQSAQCSDGQDNDFDGRIDFPADPGCSSPTDNNEGDEAACQDRRDNDGDGLIDWPLDPGCVSPVDTDEFNAPLPQCSDGQDNDGDGRVDMLDPGCSSPQDNNESDDPQCSDRIDNDGDGRIDFPLDPGCVSPTDNDEQNAPIPQCRDGIDNDFDGKIDFPLDPGCQNPDDNLESDDPVQFGCIEIVKQTFDPHGSPLPISAQFTFILDATRVAYNDAAGNARFDNVIPGAHGVAEIIPSGWTQLSINPPNGQVNVVAGQNCARITFQNRQVFVANAQCADGYDNDGDGLVDYPQDSGCTSAADNDEYNSTFVPQCRDGIDNDGDGIVDFPNDPGCQTADDNNEQNQNVVPACSDNQDNDGDGLKDYPADPGCSNVNDTDEFNVAGNVACNDGVDNDGDGLTDFPADPGCSSTTDTDEFNFRGPRCSDGLDNDGDGLIDFPQDTGCTTAYDDNEYNDRYWLDRWREWWNWNW